MWFRHGAQLAAVRQGCEFSVPVQILESALFATVPPSTKELIDHLKAENSALKIALYESVTTLARAAAVTGGEALAAALPAFVTDSDTLASDPTGTSHSSSQQGRSSAQESSASPPDPPAD